MKCPKCENNFDIKVGSKIIAKGAKILTAVTTILTVKCEKCGEVFQIPISSKPFLNIKKDDEKIN